MKLYIKPWCPWCVEALDWLQKHNIPHQILDVTTDAAAFARMRQISGQSRAPTLEMEDGSVLADFDTRQLRAFLQKRGFNL